MTRVFLAGMHSHNHVRERVNPPYTLDSYYYLRKSNDKDIAKTIQYIKSDKCKMFLLDSGAFTYMEQAKNSKGKTTDNFEQYVRDYAAFINKWDIQYFFEMDIDVIVGIEKVEEYRRLLERLTGKKSIPVFHLSRGKDYWLRMVKEYDFVAIGGLAIKTFPKNKHHYLKWFINVAHEHGTKVHGLGYTSNTGLVKYTFDTVDSTSWISATRFGNLNVYDPAKKKLVNFKPPNSRLTEVKESLVVSANEWLKFSKYIEKKNKTKVLGGW